MEGERGESGRAVVNFRRALSLSPCFLSLEALARGLLLEGAHKEAIALLREALRWAPQSPQMLHLAGHVYRHSHNQGREKVLSGDLWEIVGLLSGDLK